MKQEEFVNGWAKKILDLLYERNNLTYDELAEVMEKIGKLKDERLKELLIRVIGWGDEERAELKHFCMVAVELMTRAPLSRLKEAEQRATFKLALERNKNAAGSGRED